MAAPAPAPPPLPPPPPPPPGSALCGRPAARPPLAPAAREPRPGRTGDQGDKEEALVRALQVRVTRSAGPASGGSRSAPSRGRAPAGLPPPRSARAGASLRGGAQFVSQSAVPRAAADASQ
ncbi:wiskott-Aldrich syndrome protein family member 2-like [Phyllostomus hastatus]|uniref:wiskott-Aldrich syndrome protein family member 2-like n=1 Tax=Phyllostomus hastatus TaxID=9423 RepID=UPI001E682BD0|nr:wiskott-Aldrich syndrome protein family member 2-like [Phyllostomus hastatus]